MKMVMTVNIGERQDPSIRKGPLRFCHRRKPKVVVIANEIATPMNILIPIEESTNAIKMPIGKVNDTFIVVLTNLVTDWLTLF